jgi:serine/threonine protein kinase
MLNIKENTKISHYLIQGEIGAGGLGRVFRAVDERTGKTVAFKVLHDRFINNRKFLGIFHRELLISASLHHKHLVGFVDAHFEPPACYIVTEFIEGWPLHNFMKRMGRIPPLVALCVAIDMLQGIDYLHLHDVIHSDLSAANILLENSGRVVVTDFGLACQQDVEDYKNYMVGTPGYYSPEHISESAIVPQTDIYCAGLLLYEMLCGRKAVPAMTDRHQIIQHMRNINLDHVISSDAKMQAMLRKLLKEALQFSPSSRIQNCEGFMYEIYRILKRYKIRYARYAIKKYLIDQNLAGGSVGQHDQEIYIGTGS